LTEGNKLIKKEMISELLYGEEKYIKEFTDATKDSYSDFIERYRKHLLNKDMENLRKAGHKIKPVSQMLNLDVIVEEYERAKELLRDDSTSEKQLEESVQRMEGHVNQIMEELEQI